MELTITVPEEVEHVLEQRAKARGQDVKTFVETIIKKMVSPAVEDMTLPLSQSDAQFESDMVAFAEGTEELSPYSGTYSRADIYFNHD